MDFALVDILFSPPVWPDWAIFKNFLFDKLSCKSIPNIVGYFKEYFLAKAALATFWAIYGTNWATFIPTSGHTAWYLLLELEKMVWLTNYLVAMLNITHNYYYKNPVNDTGDVVDDKEMQIRLFSPPWPGKRGWASPAKEKKQNKLFSKTKETLFLAFIIATKHSISLTLARTCMWSIPSGRGPRSHTSWQGLHYYDRL